MQHEEVPARQADAGVELRLFVLNLTAQDGACTLGRLQLLAGGLRALLRSLLVTRTRGGSVDERSQLLPEWVLFVLSIQFGNSFVKFGDVKELQLLFCR